MHGDVGVEFQLLDMRTESRRGETIYQSKVDSSGRISLPAEIRASLGVRVGASVIVKQDGSSIEIRTPMQALREAQEYFQKLVPPGVSLADEIIQEHREEAARERE
jgi:AbrB family looped-hinge helix DNA binding protein